MIRTVDIKRKHICRPPSRRNYGRGSIWQCDGCDQRWVRNGGWLSSLNRGSQQGWAKSGELLLRRWLFWGLICGCVALVVTVALMALLSPVQ